MATTKLSQDYSVKFTGTAKNSNFSKTVSGIDYDNTFENLSNVDDVGSALENVLDSGTVPTFSLIMTEKYSRA